MICISCGSSRTFWDNEEHVYNCHDCGLTDVESCETQTVMEE